MVSKEFHPIGKCAICVICLVKQKIILMHAKLVTFHIQSILGFKKKMIRPARITVYCKYFLKENNIN